MKERHWPSVEHGWCLQRDTSLELHIWAQTHDGIRTRLAIFQDLIGAPHRPLCTERRDRVTSFRDHLQQIAMDRAINQPCKCLRPRCKSRRFGTPRPVRAVRTLVSNLVVPLVDAECETSRDRGKHTVVILP